MKDDIKMDSHLGSEQNAENAKNAANAEDSGNGANGNKREEYIRKYGMDGFPAKNNAPWLKREPENKHPRRSYSHDYCSCGYYHITATLKERTHLLSSLPDIPLSQLKENVPVYPILSPLGTKVKEEIQAISSHHPELRILQYVIMPDHIHFVLHVKERLKRMLGYELAGFFGACSHHYNELGSFSEFKPLFQRFHDSIIFNYNQLEKAIQYVRDNPRRAIIKRANPNLFKRYLHLRIGNHEFAAFGNIFLLRHFNLLPVRIHRRWSEAEFASYHNECMQKIRQGAIPVSPFIHPAEKNIMKETIALGSPLIKLTDCGFEDRFKPYGKDFDACANGRLLLLAPWPENTGRKSTAGYTEFHTMNDLAAALASLPATERFNLKGADRCF